MPFHPAVLIGLGIVVYGLAIIIHGAGQGRTALAGCEGCGPTPDPYCRRHRCHRHLNQGAVDRRGRGSSIQSGQCVCTKRPGLGPARADDPGVNPSG